MAVNVPVAGAQLSHAAYAAAGAQRMLLAAICHLEEADAAIPRLDDLLRDVQLDADNVADMLEGLGHLADALQALADAYGRWCVERRAA